MVKVSPIFKEFFQPITNPMIVLNTSCRIESLSDYAAQLLKVFKNDVLHLDEQSVCQWNLFVRRLNQDDFGYCTLQIMIDGHFHKIDLVGYLDKKTGLIYAKLKINPDNVREIEKKAQFFSIFEDVPHGIVLSDLDGKIININEAALVMIENEKCNLLNRPFVNMFKSLTCDFIQKLKYFSNLSNNGQANIEGYRTNSKNDQTYLKIESKFNSSLNIIISTITDETEKFKFKQIIERNQNLNTIDIMNASMAHEIRNSMTSLKGFIELLKLNTTDDGMNYLNVMNSELVRMDMILSDFLNLSKPIDRKFEPVSMIKIVDEVIELMKPVAIQHNVNIVFENLTTLNVKILGNDNRLKQMLINLAKNAIEVMEDGGTIIFKMKNTHDYIYLAVCDEGQGMNSETLNKLFTPFYTTKSTGTGLGLPLVKKVIDEHNGKIQVESKVGEGTTFFIELPIYKETSRNDENKSVKDFWLQNRKMELPVV